MTSTIPAGAVVVGVDGSTCAELAMDWAMEQASLEGRPLVLVHAVFPLSPAAPAYPEISGFNTGLVEDLRRDADAFLEKTAARVRTMYPDVEVHRLVRITDARVALLDAAVDASALVAGSRGLGPVRQLLLGSVSAALVKHASAPVVVVRPTEEDARSSGVLVAVAGDGHDAPVVDFAFRVADARKLPVTLVHTFWDVVGVPEGVREVPADEPGCEDQRAVLDDAARGPSQLHPSVPVDMLLSRGFADLQLIAASPHAELLVLGHRRKSFLRELIYGSVAPRVAEHAHCPVAVVPTGPTAEGTPDQRGATLA